MNISRRWFIGGAASFGAFGGARLFAADDFPQGSVTVSVVPKNWFHRRSEAISGTV